MIGKKKKILIIEDDQSIRKMITVPLEDAGYQVTETTNGKAGLAVAQEGGFDAILLDLKMPKLDGIGVLKELKENPPKNSNGPIIVFSSVEFDYVRDEASRLGAAGFLSKSEVDPQGILKTVENHIKSHKPS